MDQLLNFTVALSTNGISGELQRKNADPSTIGQNTMNQRNGKQLMEINDDCLIKIYQHMSAQDLLALAETNVRSREIARYVLSRKAYSRLYAPTYSYALCKRHLSNFGDIFNYVHVYGNHTEEFWSLMNQYCAGTNALHFENGHVGSIALLQNVFPYASKLIFDGCSGMQNISSDECTELELMRLDFDCFRGIENANYPKLVRLKIKSCINLNSIASFIERHPHIKIFELQGYELNRPNRFAEAVLSAFEDLDEIKIEGDLLANVYAAFAKKLKNVRKLIIGDTNTSYAVFLLNLATDVALEHLEIDTGTIDNDVFKMMNRFVNVSSLKLRSLFVKNVAGFGMLKNFTKLATLNIDSVYILQKQVFFRKYNINHFMAWFPGLKNLIIHSPGMKLTARTVRGPHQRLLNIYQFEKDLPQIKQKYGEINFH